MGWRLVSTYTVPSFFWRPFRAAHEADRDQAIGPLRRLRPVSVSAPIVPPPILDRVLIPRAPVMIEARWP
jgi:hypothetical protein